MKISAAIVSITSIALLVGYLLLAVAIAVWGSAECKAIGYRNATLGFPATVYCVKRIDQTDHVIPLSELK